MAEPSYEELKRRNEELEAQQAALDRVKKEGVWFQVAQSGGVSVYGLGRYPVTLYYEQWKKFLPLAPALDKFLEEHKHELKMKQ